jgi:hypothetical protein
MTVEHFTKMSETNRFRASSSTLAAPVSVFVGAQALGIQEADSFNQIFSGNWRGMEVTYPCSGTYCLGASSPAPTMAFHDFRRSLFARSAQ